MRRTAPMLFILAAALPLFAQPSLSKETVAATVAETIRLIEQNYVFPEKADAIVARIREAHAAGRYAVADAVELAARLTGDMQATTSDKHMNVAFDPPRAASLSAPPQTAPPPGGGANFFAQMMASTNYGVSELKVLPGNARYLSIAPAFLWEPRHSPKVFEGAMNFLRGGEAYIIDLRGNGGGSPDAVRHVISHFMEPDRKLMTYRMGPEGTSESRTEKVERLPAKPLYVLIGPGTASASEEFAAHVKHFKLGTLVGSTTAGAGNRNALYGTKEGFVVSVSVGTAIHAASNSGWEGSGISPDLAVAPPLALDAAHLDALKKVRTASAGKNPQLEHAIDLLSAKVNPIRLTESELRAYTGAYGAERKVTMREGHLFWHFAKNEWQLVPLGGDRFGFISGPNVTLRFTRDGEQVSGVTELFASGKQESFPRASS